MPLSAVYSPGSLGRTAGSLLNVLSRPYSPLSHRPGLAHVRHPAKSSPWLASCIPYVPCILCNFDSSRRPQILGGRLLPLCSHTPTVITLPRCVACFAPHFRPLPRALTLPFVHFFCILELLSSTIPAARPLHLLSPPAGLPFASRKARLDLSTLSLACASPSSSPFTCLLPATPA